MLFKIIYLFVFLLSVVKCDELSDAKWTDMNNKTIHQSIQGYCKNKNCIVKCCPIDNFITVSKNKKEICFRTKNEKVKRLLNFSEIRVYKAINASTIINTTENLAAFKFVQNEILSNLNRTRYVVPSTCETYILEDGSIKQEYPCDIDYGKLEFCVDFLYAGYTKTSSGSIPKFDFTVRVFDQEMQDGKSRHIFIIVGFTVSSIFSALVVVVYYLLPKLRTFKGIILLAYLSTFIVTCIIKVVQLATLNDDILTSEGCRHLTAALYFAILATFFWLNTMTLDMWRSTATVKQPNNSNRPGQLTTEQWKKFRRHCIYAFGTPALITLVTVAVDRFKLASELYKPPFTSCFTDDKSTMIYLHVPIGIITVANFILFAMTAYTIWMTRAEINKSFGSKNTNKSKNRFFIYLKIYVLTGVTWILELLPNNLPFELYIILNFYNLFVGVAIFYIFVCKKSVVLALCKKLNIKNSFVNKLQSSQYQTENTTSIRINTDQRFSSLPDPLYPCESYRPTPTS